MIPLHLNAAQNIKGYELRILVAFVFMMDIEKDGLVRPDEMLQLLHAIPMKSPDTGGWVGLWQDVATGHSYAMGLGDLQPYSPTPNKLNQCCSSYPR